MEYSLIPALIERATELVTLTYPVQHLPTLEQVRDVLREVAQEWHAPEPPLLPVLRAQLAEAWDEDLSLGEIAFTLDVLGPTDPQLLRITIRQTD